MTEKKIVYYATQTSGMFRKGHSYAKEQLGVIGRMALRAGHLIPVEEATKRVRTGAQSAVRPRSARRGTQTKGGGDGVAGAVESGGSPEVRPS